MSELEKSSEGPSESSGGCTCDLHGLATGVFDFETFSMEFSLTLVNHGTCPITFTAELVPPVEGVTITPAGPYSLAAGGSHDASDPSLTLTVDTSGLPEGEFYTPGHILIQTDVCGDYIFELGTTAPPFGHLSVRFEWHTEVNATISIYVDSGDGSGFVLASSAAYTAGGDEDVTVDVYPVSAQPHAHAHAKLVASTGAVGTVTVTVSYDEDGVFGGAPMVLIDSTTLNPDTTFVEVLADIKVFPDDSVECEFSTEPNS